MTLFASLLFSSVGGVYLIIGKRLSETVYIICGAALLISCYVINNALLLTIVGIAISLIPLALKRGWLG
jgi:hypothetical protein